MGVIARREWRWAVAAGAAGVFGVLLAIMLGNWQTRRAEDKLSREARWRAAESEPARELRPDDAAALKERLPQRVRLRGHFVFDKSVWLDNRPLEGRAGLLLLTPLVLDGSAAGRATVVLVMRGWAPRDPQDRQRLPRVAQPPGTVMVEGLAIEHAPRVLALSKRAEPLPLPAIWQNLDHREYARASGLAVVPWVLQQTGGDDDGLVRRWPRPDTGVEKHRGYALQWYSLAGLIGVLTVVLAARRGWRARRLPSR